MSKKFKFTLLALSISLLSACGSGGDKRSVEIIDGEPITPYTSFGLAEDLVQERTVSTAAGSDGEIVAFIDGSNELSFVLDSDLDFLIIDDVQRAETFSFSCPNGTNAQVSFFENYATGVEEVSASINGQKIKCRSTYPTGFFPSVIGTPSSIADLLVFWDVSDAGEYISTNCPSEESVNNPFNQDIDPDPSQCETSLYMDATVTDEDGFTHLVSYENISIPGLEDL